MVCRGVEVTQAFEIPATCASSALGFQRIGAVSLHTKREVGGTVRGVRVHVTVSKRLVPTNKGYVTTVPTMTV